MDWIAMLFGFYGTYRLGLKDRNAFILLSISICCWLIFGITVKSIPLIISGVINLTLHIRNYKLWKEKKE